MQYGMVYMHRCEKYDGQESVFEKPSVFQNLQRVFEKPQSVFQNP